VRGEQDGEPLLAREARDLLPHVGPHLGIQAGRRLVEEEHVGAVHQPHGDVEPPLHASGVGPGEPAGDVRQPESLQQVVDARAQRAAAQAVDLALELEVLAPGALPVGAGALGDDADPPAHLLGLAEHVDAGHPGLAGVGP
jgi:hypothetical protein